MIDQFRGEYRWLSNFYLVPIEYEGIIYPSSEHAYQAAKTEDPEFKKYLAQIPTCSEVKKWGGTIDLRPGWNDMRSTVMYDILLIKFTRHKDLLRKLLKTRDHKLVEGNYWGDTFWGVCNGEGKNKLGKILMLIRQELSLEFCSESEDMKHSHEIEHGDSCSFCGVCI